VRQSTILVGVLLAAFAMYVVLRGDGKAWLSLFVKHGAHETIKDTSSGSSGGSSTADTIKTAAEVAKVAAVVFA
jgi:hypothetical protein